MIPFKLVVRKKKATKKSLLLPFKANTMIIEIDFKILKITEAIRKVLGELILSFIWDSVEAMKIRVNARIILT